MSVDSNQQDQKEHEPRSMYQDCKETSHKLPSTHQLIQESKQFNIHF